MSALLRALFARLEAAATLPIALLLLFEEWGWEPLKRAMAQLMRWPPLAWVERRIASLPPWAALVAFAAPSLLLVPVKIGALWLFALGQKTLGLVLVVAAKVVGTALVARLFHLTQPALMRLRWFAELYPRWVAWKQAWFARVRGSWVWRVGRVLKRRARAWWARRRTAG